MASTYVNDLRLNEMATGDASGTWGTVTNANLELIGEALGYGTEAITTNADTHTSTVADGSTDPARAMFIKYTGTLDSTCTITIAPNTLNRLHFIHNATSGSQSIIIKQGSGATITIPTGDTKAVYLDGAGSGAAVTDAFASLSVVDLKVQDDLSFTSDSAVVSFGADADTTLTHTDGSGLTLNGTNKLMFNDASQFIHAPSATVLDIAATDTIELTATTTAIVGNQTVSGDIDVDGTTNLDVVDIDGAVNVAADVTIASTNKIIFNDASQFIQGASATVLDIAATDEIELTATLIDVVGNQTVSGTLGVTGIATFTDDIIIGDGKTIGSASDVDAMTIASNGQVTFTQTLIGTALDISGDIDVDGTTNLDAVDIDGAVQLGASDDDVRMTLTGNNQYRLTLVNGTADSVILGSGGANNFRISNSGGSTLFELNSSGNIVLPTASAGIYLGVTSATASNLLDDYEEGTFEVGITATTGTLGLSATTNTLSYTKIGQVVHFRGYINNDTFSGASGTVTITGFPFAVSDLTEFSERPAILISVTGSSDNGAKAGIMVATGTTVIMQTFDASSLDSDVDLYLSGSYPTG
jgi:hypothetical protein